MNVDLFDDILCNEEIPIELEINDVIELWNRIKRRYFFPVGYERVIDWYENVECKFFSRESCQQPCKRNEVMSGEQNRDFGDAFF